MVQEIWSSGKIYNYCYSAEGNLAQKIELQLPEGSTDPLDAYEIGAVYYEYDSLGRLIRSSQSDTTGYIQRTEHLYDKENRISRQSWQAGGNSYTENYTYNTTDGSLTKVEITGVPSYAFSYDALKRLSSRYNYTYKQSYTYQNRSDDSTKTTMLVSKLDYTARPAGTSFTPFSLNYTYDVAGNITSVTGSSITGQNASYSYDAQGQLIQETNATGTYQYNYDTYGNIRSVTKDGATIASYGYGDSEWLDKLTVYNSKPIGYDAIGNPENWYSETGEWEPIWENGRQLSRLEPAGENTSSKIEFTYDLAGIRSSKKVGNTTYHYITQNGKVIRQTWGSNDMDFIYDNNGNPYALKYNGTTYFYVLNQQGDVIKILNYSGAEVASYTYDAWGKVLSVGGSSTTIANANPLRYRGYYYDTESGLYYLGSRYYDPVVKRFINADSSNLITANPYGLTDKNLFSYCDNNPVNRKDDGGEFWGSVVASAVLGGITSAFDAVIAGEDTTGVIKAATKGAVSGAISGVIGGVLTAAKAPTIIKAVASATYSAAANVYNQKKANPNAKIDWYSVTTSVGTSLISTTVSTVNKRVVSSATRGLSKSSERVVKYVTSGIKNVATYTYKLAFRSIRKELRGRTS